MKKIIFLHRSVGNNLIQDGNVYELLASYPDISFTDFNQNTGLLRNAHSTQNTEYTMPGGNTTPRDYAELFSSDYSSPLKDFVMNHDVVIIKSCYPNSNIKTSNQLETIKDFYRSITRFFTSYPDKHLVIMTSPPLTPFMTTKDNAKRADTLAQWMCAELKTANCTLFDLRNELTDERGMLKQDYRRLWPFDSHPNSLASRTIVSKFIASLLLRKA